MAAITNPETCIKFMTCAFSVTSVHCTFTLWVDREAESSLKTTIIILDKIFVSHALCVPYLCRCRCRWSAHQDACCTGWLRRPSWACCSQMWRHEEKQTVCSPSGPPAAASAQPSGPNYAPSRTHKTDTHETLYVHTIIPEPNRKITSFSVHCICRIIKQREIEAKEDRQIATF